MTNQPINHTKVQLVICAEVVKAISMKQHEKWTNPKYWWILFEQSRQWILESAKLIIIKTEQLLLWTKLLWMKLELPVTQLNEFVRKFRLKIFRPTSPMIPRFHKNTEQKSKYKACNYFPQNRKKIRCWELKSLCRLFKGNPRKQNQSSFSVFRNYT